MKESKFMFAWGKQQWKAVEKRQITKVYKILWGVKDKFTILVVIMTSQVYTCIRIHQFVLYKYVCFTDKHIFKNKDKS